METTPNPATRSVRIEVPLLDALMNLAGELVLCRNQLLQAIAGDDRRLLEITGQRIDLVTSEIQEQIMRTRMQPIGELFDRLPSVVSELARNCGKPIDLSLTGKTVDIDKTVMEALESPMTRLIESAVHHGIEAPEVRQRLGKSAKGSISISAYHEAGQVVIDVEDDGIDIDQGDEDGKTDPTALPGLEEIRAELEAVSGSIHANPKKDHGKQVRIKLPLTLSIIPSQIIRLNEERFAIPQVNLSELLRIPAGQVKQMIETVGGAEVIRLRGELLPVIDLARSLGMERTFVHPNDGKRHSERRVSLADRRSKDQAAPQTDYEGPERREDNDRRCHPDTSLNIAVVTAGKYKYGLVVDAMSDSEEIVVKPLGKHLKDCHGFAGATIMGDGEVALILDVASIGEMAGLRGPTEQEAKQSVSEAKSAPKDDNIQSYLFFSNADTERLAVPLDAVARIEKVDAVDIETVAGSRVLKYQGGSLPLIALHESIAVDPLPVSDYYQVICFTINGREVGLLAAPPVDAAEVTVSLDEKTLKQPGVLGSTVINDRTTLFLDIAKVVKNTKPELFNGV
jgi:two-component system chemotaxis sensor kinase CheA